MAFYLACMEGPSLEDWGLWSAISMVDGPGVWSGKGAESDMLSEDRDCRDRDSIIAPCKASMDTPLLSVLLFARDEVPPVLHCVVTPDIKEVPEESVGREPIDGDWVSRLLSCDDDWVLAWLTWSARLSPGTYRGSGRGEPE